MKRLVLALLLVMFAITAHAGCVTNQKCLLWTDAGRFAALLKVMWAAGPESIQGIKMIEKAMDEGIAISVPKGTKATSIASHGLITVVEVGGVRLMGSTDWFNCD